MDAATIKRRLKSIKNYHGFIFAKDVTNQGLKDGYYAVNLDRVTGNGTHWTGMAIQHKNIYYFDSYGVAPPQEIVDLKRHGYRIYYNSTQYQKPTETNCGDWVIKFIRGMHKKNNDFQGYLFSLIK